MKTPTFKVLLTLASLHLAPAAFCQLITPVAVSGSGAYSNAAALIIDGVVPAEETHWQNAANVWWEGTQASFTVDLGNLYHIDNILLSVDNNDSYQVDYSIDGLNFTKLFTTDAAMGNVPSNPGGMDTSVSQASGFLPAITYDVNPSMFFTTVDARYLRIEAVGGDDLYSVAEVMPFGKVAALNPVPEPSTYGLMAAGLLAGLAFWRRSRKA
jgi:hypothetical protein